WQNSPITMFLKVLMLCSCSSVPSGRRQCLCQFFTVLSLIRTPEVPLRPELVRPVDEVEGNRHQGRAGDAGEAALRAGILVEPDHVVHADAVPPDDDRHGVGGMVLDGARRGMVAADDD